jgi:hypothetical protein
MTLLLLPTGLQVLAAVFAILIARLRATYLPAAVALTLIPALTILVTVIEILLHGLPVPYEGTARVLFHVEVAAKLAQDAVVGGLAVAVAVGPERRRLLVGCVVGVWVVASVIVAILYPSPLVRGLGLARVYFGSTLLGIAVGTLALVAQTRAGLAEKRSPTGAEMVGLFLVLLSVGVLLVPFSPWRAAPFPAEAFSGVQIFIAIMFGFILGTEVIAWWFIRLGSST